MHLRETVIDEPATPHGNKQPARGNEISIYNFEQRKQRRSKNSAHDPARTDCLLECNSGHERLTRQDKPRRNVSNSRDHDDVENESDNDRSPYRAEITLSPELRISFFGGFRDGLESG